MHLIQVLIDLLIALAADPLQLKANLSASFGVQDLIDLLQNYLNEHWNQYNVLDPLTWFAIWMWIMMILTMLYKFLS